MGSPPPAGSKKEVLMFRSVNSIVMAPASTGRDSRSRIVVIIIDQIIVMHLLIFIMIII